MAKKRRTAVRGRLKAGKHADCAYYSPQYCPKETPQENLEWRIRWREAAIRDKWVQRDFRQAAFDDVLFWFNAFGWCFEPRGTQKVRPFCTWPHQDPAILAMDKAMDDAERTEEPVDLVVDKSRGQGATWMYLLVFLRRWLRDPMFSAGLVTRNEKLVDSAKDPDTLMWKVVWAIKMLPYWMLPEGFDLTKHRSLSDHSLANPENDSTIVGYSATGDVARGGRKTVFAMDELAAFKPGEDYAALNSTQHVTNCRFLVSTYLGDSGAYYDAAQQDGNAIKVVLDWRENPTQNRKLYRPKGAGLWEMYPGPGNKLTKADRALIREQHTKLVRRGFRIDDTIRNIWYNNQCLRPGSTPRGIAQELDRNPHGSVAKVFSSEVLARVLQEKARPPLVQGSLVYDAERAVVRAPYLVEGETGELKLWLRSGLNGTMPWGDYIVGADISAGTAGAYSSNSVACVVNRMTGEQVAEWVSNSVVPGKFACVCVALARWFHGALLIPEANFSAGFMKTLVEDLAYERTYYREVDVVGLHKVTNKPGFWMTNDDIRLKVFEGMQEAMADGAFTPRSAPMIEECKQYQWKAGRIIHVGSTKSDDEGAKGKAHGDRVIAAALAWFGCADTPAIDDPEGTETVAPEGSMAARLQEHDRREGRVGDPWYEADLDIFQESGVSCLTDAWS